MDGRRMATGSDSRSSARSCSAMDLVNVYVFGWLTVIFGVISLKMSSDIHLPKNIYYLLPTNKYFSRAKIICTIKF